MSDFIAILNDLRINTTYWTMSAKCVTLHNSACYQISGLCEHLRIFWGKLPEIQKTYYGPLKRDNLDVVWKSASTNVCWLLQYLLSPTHLFAIAFRELKFGPNLLMFFWYFFLTLLLHDHDFWVLTESLELDDTKVFLSLQTSGMIQYRRFHCKFIFRAALDVMEATFRIRQLSQRSWQCLKTFNDEESQMLKSYRNSISVQITLKTRLCWSVQSRRVTFISLWWCMVKSNVYRKKESWPLHCRPSYQYFAADREVQSDFEFGSAACCHKLQKGRSKVFGRW